METPPCPIWKSFAAKPAPGWRPICPPRRGGPMATDEDTFWGGRNPKFSSEPQRVWFERMREKGWTVPHWPKEYGGGGLDPEEAKIVRQEMAALGARPALG